LTATRRIKRAKEAGGNLSKQEDAKKRKWAVTRLAIEEELEAKTKRGPVV